MDEAKYTPGPWWVEESGVRDRGGYICHTRTAQRYPDQEERFIKETAERAANKALIAAAPELLEALQEAIDCGMVPSSSCSDGGASKYSRQVQVADMIRAAVAKATGK